MKQNKKRELYNGLYWGCLGFLCGFMLAYGAFTESEHKKDIKKSEIHGINTGYDQKIQTNIMSYADVKQR